MKRYIFTILLVVTFLTGAPFVYGKILEQSRFAEHIDEPEGNESDTETMESAENTELAECEEIVESKKLVKDNDDSDGEWNTNDFTAENEVEQPLTYNFTTVDESYFNDALFIGDSRTVGLSEYANLGEADVYADSGMSVYNVLESQISMKGIGKMTLTEVLSARQYGKIYFMMGINELGYDFQKTVSTYQKMVEKIKELQPGAIIFLGANQHVTANKSNKDFIFNNANINRLNAAIKELADSRTTFYIDVNELFDDAQGNLEESISSDEVHVLGKHYARWADWLCTMGIIRQD